MVNSKLLENIEKDFIFGNDAIVRGALESGVSFVASYPGTPASEIADRFFEISKNAGIYFEFSTNEKVALEAAAGAAFSGAASMVVMKHYGLNVASDSLLPLVYLECPLVVVVADDPGCFSSVQTEQDTRWFSRMGLIPTFEPANPEEALDMTKKAFEIAWGYKTPVLIRLTTRVCYTKQIVNFGKIQKLKKAVGFKKDISGFKLSSKQTVLLHQKTLKKIKKIQEFSQNSKFNYKNPGTQDFGVICSGVSFDYFQETLDNLNLQIEVLKLGFTYPLPYEKIINFLKKFQKVLIIEEIDPILENDIKKIAQDYNIETKIIGKKLISKTGELGPEDIEIAILKILDRPIPKNLKKNIENFSTLEQISRIPYWCPGCPHRETFTAVKKALPADTIFGGDIGCYMMGVYPPIKLLDFVVAMGAGAGITHGISKATRKKLVAFIGDSTFFHSGLPSILNMVFNKSDVLVIILDNRCTAMTGHQPHPGTGFNGMENKTQKANIENIVRSLGVENIKTINVYDSKNTTREILNMYKKPGVNVIIASGECVLFKKKQMKKKEQDG